MHVNDRCHMYLLFMESNLLVAFLSPEHAVAGQAHLLRVVGMGTNVEEARSVVEVMSRYDVIADLMLDQQVR